MSSIVLPNCYQEISDLEVEQLTGAGQSGQRNDTYDREGLIVRV